MEPNPYKAPKELAGEIRLLGCTRLAVIAAGLLCFLMPSWVALIRQCWPDCPWLGMPYPPDNPLQRIAASVGGGTMFVFWLPLIAGIVAVMLAPFSPRLKAGFIASLFPLLILQCFAIALMLVMAGRLSG